MTKRPQDLLLVSYQECNDIVALLLQPDQDAGSVQSTTVGQNHGTFRHDETVGSNRERPWGVKADGINHNLPNTLVTSVAQREIILYNLNNWRVESTICALALLVGDSITSL